MIYADYNGSAPLCHDVVQYLDKRLKEGPFSNPNAIHALGSKVSMAMEKARSECAKALGAKPNQVIFNSGSTEGISTIFHTATLDSLKAGRNIIVTSGIEHAAVVNNAKFYEGRGFTIKIIPTNEEGVIDLKAAEIFINENAPQIALVTLMAANNETGVLQPYKEIAAVCNRCHVPYFSDTTQLIGKTDFNFIESGIDYAIVSGHKLGALTGSGLVLAKDPSQLKCLIIGGGQEKGLRGGTQNYIGNETLAIALNYFKSNLSKLDQLRKKRDEFEDKLLKAYPQLVIFGKTAPRVANTTFLALPGVHGQGVQIELEARNIFVTTSSACSDNEPVTSKVLKAMNVKDDAGRGAVRVSLGPCSDLNDYDKLFEAFDATFKKLSKIKSY